ncbi:uncharacterized protein EI90DRAFT_3014156 [Cantharellus anzutake]|uniref:uncharacterized protein n=1 Tax=Cantharellus anzutake TaxID=1750568 RepID=UPI0019061494|nr:uncharacterized protein EI90DRAFT_3014156 [Cantharellus anzutake]KAF8336381.1 hypothetical protein EI90DRAFT_3014156 [Cantharellus anzutake]
MSSDRIASLPPSLASVFTEFFPWTAPDQIPSTASSNENIFCFPAEAPDAQPGRRRPRSLSNDDVRPRREVQPRIKRHAYRSPAASPPPSFNAWLKRSLESEPCPGSRCRMCSFISTTPVSLPIHIMARHIAPAMRHARNSGHPLDTLDDNEYLLLQLHFAAISYHSSCPHAMEEVARFVRRHADPPNADRTRDILYAVALSNQRARALPSTPSETSHPTRVDLQQAYPNLYHRARSLAQEYLAPNLRRHPFRCSCGRAYRANDRRAAHMERRNFPSSRGHFAVPRPVAPARPSR